MSCDLPGGENWAFNPAFAESSFSMKEVIVPVPAPQPGAPGSQPTHIQHLSSTNTLPRPYMHSNNTSQSSCSPGKPGRNARVHSQAVAFPSDHLSCTFSSPLIESAENCRAWPSWAPVPDGSAKSNNGFVDPKSHTKRWKFISFPNAEILTGLLLQIISHWWGRCGWNTQDSGLESQEELTGNVYI